MFATFSKKAKISLVALCLLVVGGAATNYSQSLRANNAKLPEGLTDEPKYLKWIDKWQDRFPQLESDYFKKVDDGEIISSTNPRYTFSEPNLEALFAEIELRKTDKYTVISPDKEQFLTFRNWSTETKEATSSYVYYRGMRDNKELSGPIYVCRKTDCYFDRPFFLTPDLFYLPEVQLKVYPDNPTRCEQEGLCSYELFLHEFNLKTNKRNTFVSSQLLTDFSEVEETLEDL